MIYEWKPKSHVAIDAQKAGERVEKLREKANGLLTPAMVVDDARSAKSPLHEAFEWDDDRAAEEYRLSQARHLVACLVVTIDVEGATHAPTRAFVHVKQDEDKGYTSIGHAMSDEDLRAQVLAKAWKELLAWKARYGELQELGRVFKAIETVAKKVA